MSWKVSWEMSSDGGHVGSGDSCYALPEILKLLGRPESEMMEASNSYMNP